MPDTVANEMYNELFSPSALVSYGSYQLMHPGLPLAASRMSYRNMAAYGLKGWHGLSFGLTSPVTDLVLKSAAFQNRTGWGSYRPIRGFVNSAAQIMSGGRGEGRAFLLANNRSLGQFALNRAERIALTQAMGSTRNIRMALTGGYEAGLTKISAQMSVRQALRATLFPSIGMQTEMAMQAYPKTINMRAAAGITDESVKKLLPATALRRLGASRLLAAATPFFGLLNAFLIADIAFKLGSLGGQIVGTTGRAIRDYSRSIGALEMGGSTAAFQTSGALTERQRSVQAIQQNSLNARQAIGQEAMFFHA